MPSPLDDSLKFDRRRLLFQAANGFGGLALAGLLSCSRQPATSQRAQRPPRPAGLKAKHVIYLYMDGAPSQIDTFDPKPLLAKEHGNPISLKNLPPLQFNSGNVVMQSPFRFQKYGQCGADVSEIFPHVATCVDELAFIRSMKSDHGEHATGNLFMNTGHQVKGRPSLGAWLTYGLGSECDNLPGFVVLDSGAIPVGGIDCFSNGFLPAKFQGTLFRRGPHPVADLQPREAAPPLQQAKLSLIDQLNRETLGRLGGNPELDAVIANYEMAFRMQTAVPDLLNYDDETHSTLSMYGIDQKETETFGTRCLLARRLVERGVRFVQLLTPKLADFDHWDQHDRLAEGHRANAQAVDKPIAGLLKDLRARGLLDETLVIWGGEFGRTPMEHTMPAKTRFRDGRGHNRFGFTIWMAGGGVRPGTIYGATDDWGFHAIDDHKVHVHDLHATILHLLGIDHTELTYRWGGRDFRLTDVSGEVVKGILA